MTGVTFDDFRWLHLLWVVVGLAVLGVFGVWRRQVALRRFAAAALLPRLTAGVRWPRALVQLGLVIASLIALTAALIGPRWGEQTQTLLRRNIDVLILLDVSRSMLARDIAPNRLDRAKLAIRDDLLPALGGDRVGLVTFAGAATLTCPLTTDYGFFRLALEDVSTRSTPRGGTLIGDAIRRAGGLFAEDRVESHKVILLITDGEDHESFPVEAAASVWQDQQVPILAVALGDPEQGSRIPLEGTKGESFLQHGGEAVRSRADFPVLEQVARASPLGVFVPVGTSNFDLGRIYSRVVQAIRVEEDRSQRQVRQPLQAHPFAVLALLLVLVDSFLREGPRTGGTGGLSARVIPRRNTGSKLPVPPTAAAGIAALLLLTMAPAGQAESPHELIVRGNEHYASGRFAEALESYRQAAAQPDGQTPEVLHDLAAAHFKLGQLDDARDLWTRLKESGDAAFEARTRYNLGNCDYADALAAAPQGDAKKSLAALAAAVEQYRTALRLDPMLADARANIELAQRLKQQIEEQQQQQSSQPSSQPQSQPSQSPQSQPSQQNRQQEQSSDQQDQSQQASEQPDSQPADQEQPQPSEESPEGKQEQPQTQPTTAPATQPATTQPAHGQPEDAEKVLHLPRAQAERLLQMIRDAEQARREKLARELETKQKPVEKDW